MNTKLCICGQSVKLGNTYCSSKCVLRAHPKKAQPFEDYYVPEPNTGCWLWIGARHNGGYGNVRFRKSVWQAHRVSWVRTHGEIPEGLDVLHKCDVPPCVNPVHLFLGTDADNVADKRAKGREFHPSGEDCPAHRLTIQQVMEIRERYAAGGITQDALSKEYGIVQSSISALILGQSWKTIPLPTK